MVQSGLQIHFARQIVCTFKVHLTYNCKVHFSWFWGMSKLPGFLHTSSSFSVQKKESSCRIKTIRTTCAWSMEARWLCRLHATSPIQIHTTGTSLLISTGHQNRELKGTSGVTTLSIQRIQEHFGSYAFLHYKYTHFSQNVQAKNQNHGSTSSTWMHARNTFLSSLCLMWLSFRTYVSKPHLQRRGTADTKQSPPLWRTRLILQKRWAGVTEKTKADG